MHRDRANSTRVNIGQCSDTQSVQANYAGNKLAVAKGGRHFVDSVQRPAGHVMARVAAQPVDRLGQRHIARHDPSGGKDLRDRDAGIQIAVATADFQGVDMGRGARVPQEAPRCYRHA